MLQRPVRDRGARRRSMRYACESPLAGGWWDRIRRYACAVVDDVWRYENEQVALLVVGARLTEESAKDRQIYEERNARLGLGGLCYCQAADDCGLTISHQQLRVARLLAEDEADVRAGQLRVGILGVDEKKDLAVIRDMWRNGEDDTDILE